MSLLLKVGERGRSKVTSASPTDDGQLSLDIIVIMMKMMIIFMI